jgi:hypothetical protein
MIASWATSSGRIWCGSPPRPGALAARPAPGCAGCPARARVRWLPGPRPGALPGRATSSSCTASAVPALSAAPRPPQLTLTVAVAADAPVSAQRSFRPAAAAYSRPPRSTRPITTTSSLPAAPMQIRLTSPREPGQMPAGLRFQRRFSAVTGPAGMLTESRRAGGTWRFTPAAATDRGGRRLPGDSLRPPRSN